MTKSQKEEAQKEQQAKKELEEQKEAKRRARVNLLGDVGVIVQMIAAHDLDSQIRALDMVNAYFRLTHSSYADFNQKNVLIRYE